MFIIPLVEVQQEQFPVMVGKLNQRGKKKMGAEFNNVTAEELCDLMCGKVEREYVDGFKYPIGAVIQLKEAINNSQWAEIVKIDPKDPSAPYQIMQEYSDCDDVIYSWVSEKEIECSVN